MEYIGLSKEEIESILLMGIAPGINSSALTREAIAMAIEKNNVRILEDVKKIFDR